jgi:hypothetical protein
MEGFQEVRLDSGTTSEYQAHDKRKRLDKIYNKRWNVRGASRGSYGRDILEEKHGFTQNSFRSASQKDESDGPDEDGLWICTDELEEAKGVSEASIGYGDDGTQVTISASGPSAYKAFDYFRDVILFCFEELDSSESEYADSDSQN